jgi:aryl-alcohol dehydrogenase-like predicted oxidoreductase
MQFGWWVGEEESRAVLDAYAEAGGNFIDTADCYPILDEGSPSSGNVSEQILGRWLKDRGTRGQMIIATKVQGRMGPGPNDEGLSRKHILDAVEASRQRLQVDYLDLYQAHDDDVTVPLEETLAAFDSLVQRGPVRYIGCSNYRAWRLMKALNISRQRGYAAYVSLQPSYNLVERENFERELQPLCAEEGIGAIPYSPLAKGFLTGKYRRGQPLPQSLRAGGVERRYMNERGWRVLAAVDQVAQRHNAAPAQVALAWLLQRPAVVAPIVGANTPEQIRDILRAADLKLSQGDVKELDDASAPPLS